MLFCQEGLILSLVVRVFTQWYKLRVDIKHPDTSGSSLFFKSPWSQGHWNTRHLPTVKNWFWRTGHNPVSDGKDESHRAVPSLSQPAIGDMTSMLCDLQRAGTRYQPKRKQKIMRECNILIWWRNAEKMQCNLGQQAGISTKEINWETTLFRLCCPCALQPLITIFPDLFLRIHVIKLMVAIDGKLDK